MLLTELSKDKCCIELPVVDDASAQGSCRSQPWHWEGSSGFGCTMRDAIKVLICRKHGDFVLPRVSAPSWVPKMVWNFPSGKFRRMPCLGGAVFFVWVLHWLTVPGWISHFWGILFPSQGTCKHSSESLCPKPYCMPLNFRAWLCLAYIAKSSIV